MYALVGMCTLVCVYYFFFLWHEVGTCLHFDSHGLKPGLVQSSLLNVQWVFSLLNSGFKRKSKTYFFCFFFFFFKPFSSLPPSVVFFHFHFSAAGERIRLSDTMMDICMLVGVWGHFAKDAWVAVEAGAGWLQVLCQRLLAESVAMQRLWLCSQAWLNCLVPKVTQGFLLATLSIFLAKIKNRSHAGWVHIWLLGFLNNSFGKGCMHIPVFKDSCGSWTEKLHSELTEDYSCFCRQKM